MRLIDADAIVEQIKRNKLFAREPATKKCIEIIAAQPTAYDVKVVLTKIEDIREDESIRFADQAVNACVQVVKAGGKDE